MLRMRQSYFSYYIHHFSGAPRGALPKTINITIIARTHVGYEVLDSGQGTKHGVGYHKLPSNKRVEGKFSVLKLSVSIFGQTTGYRIYTVSRESIRLPKIQYLVFGV